jgi:hypothetical protein
MHILNNKKLETSHTHKVLGFQASGPVRTATANRKKGFGKE